MTTPLLGGPWASRGITLNHPIWLLPGQPATNIEAVLGVIRSLTTVTAFHPWRVVVVFPNLTVNFLSHIDKLRTRSRRRRGGEEGLGLCKDAGTNPFGWHDNAGNLQGTGLNCSQHDLSKYSPGTSLRQTKQQLVHGIILTISNPPTCELLTGLIELTQVVFHIRCVLQAQGG
jgi:hypothetical protein